MFVVVVVCDGSFVMFYFFIVLVGLMGLLLLVVDGVIFMLDLLVLIECC